VDLRAGIVRWLTAKGRFAEARSEVATHLDLPLDRVPLPTIPPAVQPRASLMDLYSVNPRLFWQTILIWGGSRRGLWILLWGPTIVALALTSTAQAAKYFIYVSGTAVIGKIIVSLIASSMGRRALGILSGSRRPSVSSWRGISAGALRRFRCSSS